MNETNKFTLYEVKQWVSSQSVCFTLNVDLSDVDERFGHPVDFKENETTLSVEVSVYCGTKHMTVYPVEET